MFLEKAGCGGQSSSAAGPSGVSKVTWHLAGRIFVSTSILTKIWFLRMSSGPFGVCDVSPVCSPSQASEAEMELPATLVPAVGILDTLL